MNWNSKGKVGTSWELTNKKGDNPNRVVDEKKKQNDQYSLEGSNEPGTKQNSDGL